MATPPKKKATSAVSPRRANTPKVKPATKVKAKPATAGSRRKPTAGRVKTAGRAPTAASRSSPSRAKKTASASRRSTQARRPASTSPAKTSPAKTTPAKKSPATATRTVVRRQAVTTSVTRKPFVPGVVVATVVEPVVETIVDTYPEPKKPLSARSMKLRKMMLERRVAVMREIQGQLGQALTEEQQRRFESAMDSGDQALLDLEREMDISLQEKRNRERQMIDEALVSLDEGTYGVCAECGTEISEKRLVVMPFTRQCVACQQQSELFEKIERGEQRT